MKSLVGSNYVESEAARSSYQESDFFSPRMLLSVPILLAFLYTCCVDSLLPFRLCGWILLVAWVFHLPKATVSTILMGIAMFVGSFYYFSQSLQPVCVLLHSHTDQTTYEMRAPVQKLKMQHYQSWSPGCSIPYLCNHEYLATLNDYVYDLPSKRGLVVWEPLTGSCEQAGKPLILRPIF